MKTAAAMLRMLVFVAYYQTSALSENARNWGPSFQSNLPGFNLNVGSSQRMRFTASALRGGLSSSSSGRGSTVFTIPPQEQEQEQAQTQVDSRTRAARGVPQSRPSSGRTLGSFVDRSSRLGFMRKVFSIVLLQLLTTAGVTYLMMENAHIPAFLLAQGRFFMIGILITSMLCVLSLSSVPGLRYRKPYNFMTLGLFTLCQSSLLGVFSSQFPAKSVYLGSSHTIMALFAVIMYSTQPNPSYDLTAAGNGLLALLSSLVVGGIANIYAGSSLVDNALLGCSAAVFVAYMMRDIQLIVGNKTKRAYGEGDYIMAALSLYESVINLLYRMIEIANRTQQGQREKR
jgi:FtsH-binding integral membrane protein